MTELTVRSNYKPQKVTTLRMSEAGANVRLPNPERKKANPKT